MNAPLIPFSLPILSYDVSVDSNGKKKTVKKESSYECFLDNSVASELRWETYFPEQKKNLGDFDVYVKSLKNNGKGLGDLLSMLKAVYCIIDFGENKVSFKDFASMFSFSDKEYAEKLVGSISEIFELAYPQEKKQSF